MPTGTRDKHAVKRGTEIEKVHDIAATGEDPIRKISKNPANQQRSGHFRDFVRKSVFLPQRNNPRDRQHSNRPEDPVCVGVPVEHAKGHPGIVDPHQVEEAGDHFDEIRGRVFGKALQDHGLRDLIQNVERQREIEKQLHETEAG